MVKKEKEKICVNCHRIINSKDKHVLLGTYEGKKTLDESWFHFQCFAKYHNDKVTEKARNTVKHASKKVTDMVGNLMRNSGIDLKKETEITF